MGFWKTLTSGREFHPSDTAHGSGSRFAARRSHGSGSQFAAERSHGTGTQFAADRSHGVGSKFASDRTDGVGSPKWGATTPAPDHALAQSYGDFVVPFPRDGSGNVFFQTAPTLSLAETNALQGAGHHLFFFGSRGSGLFCYLSEGRAHVFKSQHLR